jgi:hypothetical protein
MFLCIVIFSELKTYMHGKKSVFYTCLHIDSGRGCHSLGQAEYSVYVPYCTMLSMLHMKSTECILPGSCDILYFLCSNPDQSKHLETATMLIDDIWIDFVNLRSEKYAENSRIPTVVCHMHLALLFNFHAHFIDLLHKIYILIAYMDFFSEFTLPCVFQVWLMFYVSLVLELVKHVLVHLQLITFNIFWWFSI